MCPSQNTFSANFVIVWIIKNMKYFVRIFKIFMNSVHFYTKIWALEFHHKYILHFITLLSKKDKTDFHFQTKKDNFIILFWSKNKGLKKIAYNLRSLQKGEISDSEEIVEAFQELMVTKYLKTKEIFIKSQKKIKVKKFWKFWKVQIFLFFELLRVLKL